MENTTTNAKPTKGEVLTVSIYGHPAQVRVLKVWPLGTMDVQRLKDGECFRITGLGWA